MRLHQIALNIILQLNRLAAHRKSTQIYSAFVYFQQNQQLKGAKNQYIFCLAISNPKNLTQTTSSSSASFSLENDKTCPCLALLGCSSQFAFRQFSFSLTNHRNERKKCQLFRVARFFSYFFEWSNNLKRLNKFVF